MRITETDDKKRVHVPFVENGFIEIMLPSMPSSGFLWEISNYKKSMMQLESMDFIADSDAIGCGGITVAKFRMIHRGKSDVVMIYRRPWLTETHKIFTVTIDLEKEII